jgi:hypothetical protein
MHNGTLWAPDGPFSTRISHATLRATAKQAAAARYTGTLAVFLYRTARVAGGAKIAKGLIDHKALCEGLGVKTDNHQVVVYCSSDPNPGSLTILLISDFSVYVTSKLEFLDILPEGA